MTDSICPKIYVLFQTWDGVKACMRRTGKENVIRKVVEFKLDEAPPDVISDVSDIIIAYDEDTVRTASAGAATFYCWVGFN